MPLGFERLNERSKRANTHINFIKPLASSSPEDQKIATDFLERIAAQCYPVMKKDYISVMALEEYPPNPEFLGRNFNAGEVIQLVLKDKTGRWLSYRFVQMVMMHELAHCKQMNHSRYFWQVRNQYADHMKELWTKKYEGEGIWGRGRELTNGEFEHDRMPDDADIPEHLCGGTYRRGRGRKRKRGQDGADKPKLTYAERQQKRIIKKFGKHGEGHDLGEDELVRGGLQQGKKSSGKPRVANSKRGRELRASAALARFEAVKQQQVPEKTPELEEDDGSETEDSDDEYGGGLPILDTLEKIKDQRGHDLYRVCRDEEDQDEAGKEEMDELLHLGGSNPSRSKFDSAEVETGERPLEKLHEDSETESEPEKDDRDTYEIPMETNGRLETRNDGPKEDAHYDGAVQEDPPAPESFTPRPSAPAEAPLPVESSGSALNCPICSLENEPDSPTCLACSHVLKTSLMPNHWRCKSGQCIGSQYVNAGDAGRCGLCGAQKPTPGSKPFGITDADVLRWD